MDNEDSPESVLHESTAGAVLEEDAPLETCRKIANCSDNAFSPTQPSHLPKGREILEYHDGVNSTTILGELFGQNSCGRFVRLLLDEPAQTALAQIQPTAVETMQFLERSGAFVLPPLATRYVSFMA